jgi:phosphoribosyl-AMP cyclohydrolase / phosphoribosyl-ATP pyrophosphohydrolase
MIIPSIDLMNGQAVQLRQGKELILTAGEDPVALARRFNRYGEIAVIDLDAAMGKGDNLPLVRELCQVADVRAGGGIRDIERAQELLKAGAKRIIVGTAATPDFLQQLPKARLMVAIDHKDGEIVDQGWVNATGESLMSRAKRLEPYCGSFLCTFVSTEGTMEGMPFEALKTLQQELSCPVTVAGGVASTQEAVNISRLGLDVQVGMALYSGKLDLAEAVVHSLDFEKESLIPTIVQDVNGEVLMLAYSSPESLTQALNEGRGIYYSRSRKALWKKGDTSGHVQTLVACRTDCDRDALLFTVTQEGSACHTNAHSCFGSGLQAPDFSMGTLFNTLNERKATLPEDSYTAKLFANPVLLHKKLMEEAFEVATAPDQRNRVWELADLLFFLSVVACANDIPWDTVLAELGGRHT